MGDKLCKRENLWSINLMFKINSWQKWRLLFISYDNSILVIFFSFTLCSWNQQFCPELYFYKIIIFRKLWCLFDYLRLCFINVLISKFGLLILCFPNMWNNKLTDLIFWFLNIIRSYSHKLSIKKEVRR